MSEFDHESPRHLGRKALWFTLVPVLVAFALFGVTAWKQHYFSATDRLYAFADSSAGIAVSMPVRIQGFPVGAVKDLALIPPDGGKAPMVRISLELNRAYMSYVGKGSVLQLSREGLIGQPVLDILQRDPRERRAADGDVLAFERPRTLNEIADDLNAKATPLLTDMKEITRKLKDPEGDFMRTLGSVRQVVQHADETTVAVGALAKRGDHVVGAVGGQAERAMTSAGNILERAESNMPKVEGVLDNLLETSKHVNVAVGRVDGVVGEGEELVGEAGQMVRGAKRSWPLNRWAAPEPAPAMAIDSQDNGKSFISPRPGADAK